MEINRNFVTFHKIDTYTKYYLKELSNGNFDFKFEFSYMYLVYFDIFIYCTLFGL